MGRRTNGRPLAIVVACALVVAILRCPCPPAEAAAAPAVAHHAPASDAHACCAPGTRAPHRDADPAACPHCPHHAPTYLSSDGMGTAASSSQLPRAAVAATTASLAGAGAAAPGTWTTIPHGPPLGRPAAHRVLRL